MTVLVRPVPKRVASNGIRPFRPSIPANNIRPYTVTTWRPPVPEPLPPAPLLGPKELLGLGALVITQILSQIWGLFAGRPQTSRPVEVPYDAKFTGTAPPEGNTVEGQFKYGHAKGTAVWFINAQCQGTATTVYSGNERVYTAGGVVGLAGVELIPGGVCGPKGLRPKFKLKDGSVVTGEQIYGEYWGYKNFGGGIDVEWLGPNAQPITQGTEPLPLPDGYVPPKPEVVPEVAPLPLPVLPPAEPGIAPAPVPETQPEVAPAPGPSRPPIAPPITVPTIPGAIPAKPGSVIIVGPGGILPVPAPQPPPITDPDAHFPIPGGKPILGNGPQVKPEEIAKELGRLEQKLNAVLNPTPDTPLEWQKLLQDLWELFSSMADGTSYTLTEKCPPCDGQDQQVTTIEIPVPGAFGALGVIQNKIDGIAKLLDAQLGLKQPTCDPCPQAYVGRNISVQFRSTEISPYGDKRLRKALRYRDQSNAPLESHRDHWRDFKWESGSWMVISTGMPWGKPRVWAKSVDEGKRVLRHAAAAAGVNLDDKRHKWVTREVQGVRENPILTMEVHRDTRGLLWVAERDGPAGLPLVSADLSPSINVDH